MLGANITTVAYSGDKFLSSTRIVMRKILHIEPAADFPTPIYQVEGRRMFIRDDVPPQSGAREIPCVVQGILTLPISEESRDDTFIRDDAEPSRTHVTHHNTQEAAPTTR